MVSAKKQSSSDDDLFKVGSDATATFDNSASNPTEYASSENLDATEADEDEVDEDLDEDDQLDEEDEDEEDDEEEEYDDEDEDDDEDYDDDLLSTGPKAPSVYRKV